MDYILKIEVLTNTSLQGWSVLITEESLKDSEKVLGYPERDK